jgi:hypothetical protein
MGLFSRKVKRSRFYSKIKRRQENRKKRIILKINSNIIMFTKMRIILEIINLEKMIKRDGFPKI